jgi:hypothetical protein
MANMTIKAKPIVADKFWIVEENGQKIGTIQSSHLGIVFTKKDSSKERFSTLKLFSDKYNVSFDTEKPKKDKETEFFIYDFPCKTEPFNAGYNVTKQLPLYSKRENSISYYCAGWYLVKFKYGWSKTMNPKFITLQRNEYIGPFKTKMEMLEQLRKINSGNE